MPAKNKPTPENDNKGKAAAKIGEKAQSILGTQTVERALHLANQVAANTRAFVAGGEARVESLASIFESISQFAPRDESERMLVAQMISTHEAAMECYRRAMLNEQSFEGRDMNLKHAERLVGLYARQLEALDKHRGKGKQKITVEHVNVHAGGQAIVGDVNASKADVSPTAAEPQQAPALTDESAASADGEKLREALSVKKAPATKRAR